MYSNSFTARRSLLTVWKFIVINEHEDVDKMSNVWETFQCGEESTKVVSDTKRFSERRTEQKKCAKK